MWVNKYTRLIPITFFRTLNWESTLTSILVINYGNYPVYVIDFVLNKDFQTKHVLITIKPFRSN